MEGTCVGLVVQQIGRAFQLHKLCSPRPLEGQTEQVSLKKLILSSEWQLLKDLFKDLPAVVKIQ